MRIFWLEFRKRIRPVSLSVALGFVAVYALLFVIPYGFLSFGRQHDRYERYLIQSRLTEACGSALGEEALEMLTAWRDEYFRTMDVYFAQDEAMRRRGIGSYEEMRAYEAAAVRAPEDDVEDDVYEDYRAMAARIESDEYELQTLFMAQAYESLVEELAVGFDPEEWKWEIRDAETEAQAARYRALSARDWESNQTLMVHEMLNFSLDGISCALVFASLLLSPLVPTQDALRRVRSVQYAARFGRTLYFRQAVGALILCALVPGAAYWGTLFAFVRITNSRAFLACDLTGAMTWQGGFWYDMTLFEYAGAKFLLTLALCLGGAMLGHVVGQFVKNYAQMVGALIPVGLALNAVREFALSGLFSLADAAPLLRPMAAGLVLLTGAGIFLLVGRWNRRREIV